MTDLQEKRELAQEAKEILESKAFEAAKAKLKERLLNNLVASAPTTEKKLDFVAKLQLIDEIANELRALINDYNAAVRAQGRSQNQSSFGASARG